MSRVVKVLATASSVSPLDRMVRLSGIIGQFATCFTDDRDPDRIEHTADERVAQRTYALALGYEDLNDHDDLRHDPLLALLAVKKDPLGRDRRRDEDRGNALAGKSTLNRLELTPGGERRQPLQEDCLGSSVGATVVYGCVSASLRPSVEVHRAGLGRDR